MRKQWLLVVVEVKGERAAVTELKFSWLSITLCLCEKRNIGLWSQSVEMVLDVDLTVEQSPVLMVVLVVVPV